MSNTGSTTVLSVSKQFSRFPAGRFKADGPYSGEAFRERFLIPAIKQKQKIVVDLDGTAGFGSSFLEEAFGGTVRAGWKAEDVLSLLELRCSDESVVEEVVEYIKNAARTANG